jgi:hypothetical protein
MESGSWDQNSNRVALRLTYPCHHHTAHEDASVVRKVNISFKMEMILDEIEMYHAPTLMENVKREMNGKEIKQK